MPIIVEQLRLFHRYYHWGKARCIFIHIPKAAGTSINHAIYRRTLGHYSIAKITQKFPGLVRNSFVFSVARNPFARLLSAYQFAKIGRTNEMGIANPASYQIPEFESFDRFLFEWLIHQDLEKVDFVFQPQHKFVCIDGKLVVDFLGHTERLQEDIQWVERRLGRKLDLGFKNVVRPPDSQNWESIMDDKMRSTITQLYRKDFELLGYSEFLSH